MRAFMEIYDNDVLQTIKQFFMITCGTHIMVVIITNYAGVV